MSSNEFVEIGTQRGVFHRVTSAKCLAAACSAALQRRQGGPNPIVRTFKTIDEAMRAGRQPCGQCVQKCYGEMANRVSDATASINRNLLNFQNTYTANERRNSTYGTAYVITGILGSMAPIAEIFQLRNIGSDPWYSLLMRIAPIFSVMTLVLLLGLTIFFLRYCWTPFLVVAERDPIRRQILKFAIKVVAKRRSTVRVLSLIYILGIYASWATTDYSLPIKVALAFFCFLCSLCVIWLYDDMLRRTREEAFSNYTEGGQ